MAAPWNHLIACLNDPDPSQPPRGERAPHRNANTNHHSSAATHNLSNGTKWRKEQAVVRSIIFFFFWNLFALSCMYGVIRCWWIQEAILLSTADRIASGNWKWRQKWVQAALQGVFVSWCWGPGSGAYCTGYPARSLQGIGRPAGRRRQGMADYLRGEVTSIVNLIAVESERLRRSALHRSLEDHIKMGCLQLQ